MRLCPNLIIKNVMALGTGKYLMFFLIVFFLKFAFPFSRPFDRSRPFLNAFSKTALANLRFGVQLS